MFLELAVLDEGHVRGEHHEGFGGDVLVLFRAVPLSNPFVSAFAGGTLFGKKKGGERGGWAYLPKSPLLPQQQPEIIIRHDRRAETPGSIEPTPVRMAPPQRMSAAQSHNLPVVETHPPENGAEMRLVFRAVGKAAVGRAQAGVTIRPAGPPGDGGALHLLDRADAGEGPEVRVGDPGELLLDGFEEVARRFEAGVGAVVAFGGETHGRAVGAAGPRFFVVAIKGGGCSVFPLLRLHRWWEIRDSSDLRPTAMPCQPDDHRTVAPIVVVILLF